MAYHGDDGAASRAGTRKGSRATVIGLGLAMSAAMVVSLVHLSQRWQDAAPEREARAIEAANRRAAAAAQEQADAAEAERLRTSGAAPAEPAVDQTITVQAPPRPVVTAVPARRTESRPVRWVSEPRFRIPAEILMKPGPDRVSVMFECRVSRSGSLSGCTGTETPRGFGILGAARGALSEARLEPLLVDGRPVESVVTFGHNWTRPRAIPAPAEDRAAAPAPDAPSPADAAPVETPPMPVEAASETPTAEGR